MSTAYETDVSLGQAIFGHAQLGDQRRTARLVETFDLMRRHPGGTLPDKLASPADLRAFYRLCDSDDVTHAAIIAAARQHTLTRIAACPGAVLLVHDATELDYTTLTSLVDDLGQIGKGTRRGYVCQNVLAVEAETGEVLGLMDQILHHRVDVPDDETLTARRGRDSRESRLAARDGAFAGRRETDRCFRSRLRHVRVSGTRMPPRPAFRDPGLPDPQGVCRPRGSRSAMVSESGRSQAEAAAVASETIKNCLLTDDRIREVRLVFFQLRNAELFLEHQKFGAEARA